MAHNDLICASICSNYLFREPPQGKPLCLYNTYEGTGIPPETTLPGRPCLHPESHPLVSDKRDDRSKVEKDPTNEPSLDTIFAALNYNYSPFRPFNE